MNDYTRRETKPNGCLLIQHWMPLNRYVFDFRWRLPKHGWRQFDTSEDASYFGIWVNKIQMRVTTYCEGDLIEIWAPNEKAFNAEIEEMCAFYAKRPAFIVLAEDGDRMIRNKLYEDREEFFIDD